MSYAIGTDLGGRRIKADALGAARHALTSC